MKIHKTPHPSLKTAALIFLFMAFLGALMWSEGRSWFGNRGGNSSGKGSSAGGPMAADFTAKNLDGMEVKLSDFKGKVVLVNFWAVWCGPCQMEVPELVELYGTYRDKGFVVLGVSDPSDLKEIKSFVQEHKMSYPIVVDQGPVSEEYSVVGFPTSFLIDREGKIVAKYPGYSPNLRKRLEAEIQKIIS